MSWWYHPRGGHCRPLPGGPYIPRVFEDPTCPGGTGGSVSVSWDDIVGVPVEFPPEPHTHAWSELTDVPGCFDPCDHTHTVDEIEGLVNSDPLRDPSGDILRDPFGRSLYPPGSVPLAPGERTFDTVADMLAAPVDEWATAITLGWSVKGDSKLFWMKVADATLSDNGDSVLSVDEGGGYFAVRLGGQSV